MTLRSLCPSSLLFLNSRYINKCLSFFNGIVYFYSSSVFNWFWKKKNKWKMPRFVGKKSVLKLFLPNRLLLLVTQQQTCPPPHNCKLEDMLLASLTLLIFFFFYLTSEGCSFVRKFTRREQDLKPKKTLPLKRKRGKSLFSHYIFFSYSYKKLFFQLHIIVM